MHALNGLLPPSIVVLDAVKVADNFHARYDARRRTYHYHISIVPPAIERNHRLYLRSDIDFERMNRACKSLIGSHHFGAFCRTNSETVNRIL